MESVSEKSKKNIIFNLIISITPNTNPINMKEGVWRSVDGLRSRGKMMSKMTHAIHKIDVPLKVVIHLKQDEENKL